MIQQCAYIIVLDLKIYAALINNQTSYEDFMTIIDEGRNYRELKESIRLMKDQEDRKKGID